MFHYKLYFLSGKVSYIVIGGGNTYVNHMGEFLC